MQQSRYLFYPYFIILLFDPPNYVGRLRELCVFQFLGLLINKNKTKVEFVDGPNRTIHGGVFSESA